MSSAVYMTWENPISRAEWEEFCVANRICYSPCTVGRNVFYYNGFGGVEITFGEPDYGDLPKLSNGRVDCEAARPPAEATRIHVSTFVMGDLRSVATVAEAIAERRPGGEHGCDPELEGWDDCLEAVDASKARVGAECAAIMERAIQGMTSDPPPPRDEVEWDTMPDWSHSVQRLRDDEEG